MWQKQEGFDAITYNSESDEKVPEKYEDVPASIGVVLATITLTPNGLIKKREDVRPQFNPGIGELVVPLPGKRVKIGAQWYIPSTVRVKLQNGRYKTIKMRRVYTLKKVNGTIATISGTLVQPTLLIR